MWNSRIAGLWLSSQRVLQKGSQMLHRLGFAALTSFSPPSSLISILLRQRWWMFTASLFVREFPTLGRVPALEWRRAGIDNGAAKWPLSWRRETWRTPLQRMKIPASLLSPRRRLVRMWSVRVLTEEDIARPQIHGHNLTLCARFKGWVPGSRKLGLACSC